jgi:four helix bundle protein
LALSIYKTTKSFPKEEVYGITNQMRRSALSIPTNIAEGYGRDSDLEFERFLTFIMSSAKELEYLLLFSSELDYLDEVSFKKLDVELKEIQRMINTLIKKISASS